jgi:hypothetical protein
MRTEDCGLNRSRKEAIIPSFPLNQDRLKINDKINYLGKTLTLSSMNGKGVERRFIFLDEEKNKLTFKRTKNCLKQVGSGKNSSASSSSSGSASPVLGLQDPSHVERNTSIVSVSQGSSLCRKITLIGLLSAAVAALGVVALLFIPGTQARTSEVLTAVTERVRSFVCSIWGAQQPNTPVSVD